MRPRGGVVHWDDVEVKRREQPGLGSSWRDLGEAAGATVAGVQRIEIDPGCRPGPVHQHGSEEEIFFVLGGRGLAWMDGEVHEIGPGDTIVYLAGGPEHTVIAGEEGLDVLAFGENHDPPLVRLPRAGVIRRAGFWWEAGIGDGPLAREAAAGPLELPPPSPRPPCIVALHDVADEVFDKGVYTGRERDLARAAGSVRTGLRRAVMPPGKVSCPPHWHAAEHELFVVLEGDGALLLHDDRGDVAEETPLRAGHLVSRPAGTGVAHALRAGEGGMTYLAYGTRESGEVVYYPRSRKAWLGQVLVRVEPVEDYWDGEV